MYEKILLPLDGSELAEEALPYAEKLAGRLGSEIILTHVSELDTDPHEDKHRSYLQKMVEVTKEGASTYHDKPGNGPTIEVKSVILSGQPAEKIVEYAENENIGLIVMATHGQSGIQRWAIGSVADKVVRATTRPVILIRAKSARPDVRVKGILNKVLVPLDGSKEGEAIIPYIEELASRFKLKVILIQILPNGYDAGYLYIPLSEKQMESDRAHAIDYLNNIGARLKEKGIVVEEGLGIGSRSGNMAEQIIQFADEAQVEFLAMTTHGRSGVGRWAFGSVAERVLQSGNTPLLLVRSTEAGGKQ
ncbi:MAG: universal stress protein [Chloroflexi bacterium]|nr:universal stress protein [Chloroflexota bacterium]